MVISLTNTDFWEQIDNEESYTDLVMAIEFSSRDRVSLFIAVCDFDLVQQAIIDRYTNQLSPEFRAYRVDLDPQHLSVSGSIASLVDRETYLQTDGKAVVSVVGATALSPYRLDPATKSDRDTFFGYLQWMRESFSDFHFPIVLWVSKNIYNLMLSETPDFWSWREGVFFFKSDSNEVNWEIINFHDPINNDRTLALAASESISIEDLKQLIERTNEQNTESPLLVTLYNRLGRLYVNRLETGKYDNYKTEQNLAIECFQKAIDLASKSDPEIDIDLATSLNNLAYLYRSIGKYAQAEPLYVRALAIKEEQLGANHPSTATSLNNLAALYESIGKYAQAEPLYVRALAIREEQLGAHHPDTATSLNNLAYLYYSIGKYAQAEPLYVRALAIREEQLGAHHPDTATSLNNLAALYSSTGRCAEAEPLYVRALEIVEQSLGINHPALSM
jgi:tetratricopeptide (TPR) repeat protein